MLKLFLLFFSTLCFSYPVSDHFDGKRFFNPWGNDLKSFWEVLHWKMISARVEWPSHVANKAHPLKLIGPSDKMNLVFINHATFLIQFPGLNILTDPMFSDRASPLSFAGPKRVRPPGVDFELLPPIDVVVISHNHYDHLDLESIKRIDHKFHPLFLVPLGDEKLLASEGIQNVRAMDWWQEEMIKGTRIVFAPAQHWSARGLWDKNKSLWGSFYIQNQKTKIYFAGDTGLGPHFEQIKNKLGAPDLSLLPIGAYEPRWFMKFQHLNPEEAILAHLDLGSKKSIGMHFNTFQMTDEGIDEPQRDLGLANKKLNLREDEFFILDEGQSWSL